MPAPIGAFTRDRQTEDPHDAKAIAVELVVREPIAAESRWITGTRRRGRNVRGRPDSAPLFVLKVKLFYSVHYQIRWVLPALLHVEHLLKVASG